MDIFRISIGHLRFIQSKYLRISLVVVANPPVLCFSTQLVPSFLFCDLKLITIARRLTHMSLPQTQCFVDTPLDAPEGGLVSCVKCGQSFSASAPGTVLKHGQAQCPCCVSIYQMLYRHLGGVPPSFQTLPVEAQKKFFKSCGESLRTAPKNGRWSLVRTGIKRELVSYRESLVTTRVTQEFLPLSVWKTRGFDEQLIQEKGKCQKDEVASLTFISYFSTLTSPLACPIGA